MASSKLRRKSDKFLSPEQTRTIKPADLKGHMKLKDLSQDDLIELLCLMEGELQAKDVLLKAILAGKSGVALPLSNLLADAEHTQLVNEETDGPPSSRSDDDDEIWLGEPSAHLNHVVAYHQVVQEQMQSIVSTLEKQHKKVVNQLEEERQKHAADTAQGDDVTYMLEKEKEKLMLQIDSEKEKYTILEKERDSLLKVIETERHEQYNTFCSLINDCKEFALQVVQQSAKYEQCQKEKEKEKQKNKVLSQLMIDETKKFKEKIKLYEDEVNDFHVLEQKRSDLELKLANSEKQCKEMFHQLNEERFKNGKLQYQLNQLRKQILQELNNGLDNEEDILLVQDQIEIPIKQAVTSTIHLTNNDDRESPEPTVLPPPVQMPTGKVATVQKSSAVTQQLTPKKHSPVISVNINQNHLLNHSPNSYSAKRHSCEEKRYKEYNPTEDFSKRNSYENNTHNTIDTAMFNHSSEEITVVGKSSSLNRNSNDIDNKKHPPPAPPRRVSSLTSSDKPPIVKIPQSLQPRRSSQHSTASSSMRNTTVPDEIPILLVVICNHGWEYNNEFGITETNRLTTYLDILYISKSSTWAELTELVNMTFDRECDKYMSGEEGITSSFIGSYEYCGEKWTGYEYPHINLGHLISSYDESENIVSVRLKNDSSTSLSNLSYSTLLSTSTLQECLRILRQEKKLMVTVGDSFEGKHFASCLACWLKSCDSNERDTYNVIKIDASENLDTFDLTKELEMKGFLCSSMSANSLEELDEKLILTLDIDYVESQGITALVFDWLLSGMERITRNAFHNGIYENGHENHYLNPKVMVIAYVTKKRLPYLSQSTYRIFKMITLPALLHALLNRWLSQKLLQYSPQMISETMMFSTIKWLSNVYQNLHKSFSKIDLVDKLPDINIYINAPIYDTNKLLMWIKTFWSKHIVNTVEESVLHRTVAATPQQRDLLIKATLKALFEKVIRPGCPVNLDI